MDNIQNDPQNIKKQSNILDANMIQSTKKQGNIELSSQYSPFSLSLNMYGFEDDKQEKAFIRKVKSMVRNSPEYAEWRDYILEVKQQTRCVLTDESSAAVTIEIHHHPISMENIIKLILIKHYQDNEAFSSYDIQKTVISYHFENVVGYVPLTTTMHEKFHNGYQDIPINFCDGQWKLFWDKYSMYAPDSMIELVSKYSLIEAPEDFQKGWGSNIQQLHAQGL